MKKIIIKIAVVLLLFLIIPQRVYADEGQNARAEEMFDYIDDDNLEITQKAKEIASEGLDISFKGIAESVVGIFAEEISEQSGILKKIAAVSILCGLLSSIGEALGRKEVSELGFFVCLIALIYMVLESVSIQCRIVYDTVERLSLDFKIALPVFGAAAVSAGRTVSSPLMLGVMMSFTAFAVFFTKSIALPFLSASALLECVNCMSEKDILTSLCALLKSAVSIALRCCAFAFTAAVSLQRIGTGQASALVFKTAKSAVGAVPVVGDIMKSSVETVTAVSSMITNSFAAAAAVMVCAMCAAPIIKLSVMWLIYKLSAAVMEPVADKRIIKALNGAGDISAALIAVLFTVSISYVVCVFIILLSF